MMNAQVKVCNYDTVDEDYNLLLDLHREISINSKLYGHLIYFDDNFGNYFRSVVEDKRNNLVTVLKIGRITAGFIHLRFWDKTVFLNNICVSSALRGQGIGKQFLKESLQLVGDRNVTSFGLDVFKSNVNAFSWYKKLGLKPESEMNWKHITLRTEKFTQVEVPVLKPRLDSNGFSGLHYNDEKIATLVNDETLILHNTDFLIGEMFINHFVVTSNEISNSNKELLNCEVLETTVRMTGPLWAVLKNLNNA